MDIDIDFFDRSNILSIIEHRKAALGDGSPHPSGIYATEIPHDAEYNTSTIDYKTAESRGYFKIDFLNNSLYEGVMDDAHLTQLLNAEPIWELLEERQIVNRLAHIHDHYDIVNRLKPRSIIQLAAVLAIIRPAKRHLSSESWERILNEIWVKPDDNSYYYKKSHAVSYAASVVVQLNLLVEKIQSGEITL